MKPKTKKVREQKSSTGLKTIYMAHRYVSRNYAEKFGPFDNHDAALACAQDCLYPELAEVETIHLTSIASVYTVTPRSHSTQFPSETYYLFSDDIEEIPSNLRAGLEISDVELDDACEDCWHSREDQLSNGLIIGALISRMDRVYSYMYIVKVNNPAALTVLMTCLNFDRIVRVTDTDRRKLLDMREEAEYIKTWAHDPNKNLDERAQNLADEFWKCFVKDHSPAPTSDLEQWDTAGCF